MPGGVRAAASARQRSVARLDTGGAASATAVTRNRLAGSGIVAAPPLVVTARVSVPSDRVATPGADGHTFPQEAVPVDPPTAIGQILPVPAPLVTIDLTLAAGSRL